MLEHRLHCRAAPASANTSTPPRPEHVVVVIEENHTYDEILGQTSKPQDPFLRRLAAGSAVFTDAQAITHPSEPNYLALFSGSTQNVVDDSAPAGPYTTPSLGGEIIAAGYRFAGYSESLPKIRYTGGSVGAYKAAHNPWYQFADVPASANLPFTRFPAKFSKLPTVSFVVPNLKHDMHDGTIAQADQWLRANMKRYSTWAQKHNSLLVVTWDENDDSAVDNQIPLLFDGPMVRPGQYAEQINHYNVLRTIEDMYGLPPLGASADTPAVADVWNP